jgi:1-aminocyclopropane-1-carboxylate deaminase/D-cysteine desulfhydrase-like pyridoxal-dependent ACC family enzyme
LAQLPALVGKIRSAFAPMHLGTWPTPLEAVPGLAAAVGVEALWLKREDRSSPRYGGNKVRGLEFLLADLPPAAVCVTIGGTGSTHCLATAVHVAACGARAVLTQFPQPETPWARAVAAAAGRHATVVVRARSRAALPFALLRAWRLAGRIGRRRWIPGGGAHPRAVLGHVLAALELAPALDRPPDAVVVPLGTGGTAAGIVLGLAALRWPTRVIAVRVAPAIVANGWRVARLASGARRLLATRGVPLPAPRLPVIVNGLGAGYGHPTSAGESARVLAARHGLVLDSTYGAKAFAVIAKRETGTVQRLVFWHTFAAP